MSWRPMSMEKKFMEKKSEQQDQVQHPVKHRACKILLLKWTILAMMLVTTFPGDQGRKK